MEFNRVNDLNRVRDLGSLPYWSGDGPIPVEVLRAAASRGRLLRAQALRRSASGLARAVARLVRRLVPRLPAGAHGPDAVDYDCAHGRPC